MGEKEALYHFPFFVYALIRQKPESHIWDAAEVLYIYKAKKILWPSFYLRGIVCGWTFNHQL